jgi:hypothetical protein
MRTDDRSIHLDSLGRPVLVRELTTADMRAMLRAREQLGEGDVDPLELLTLDDGLLLSDLGRLSDVTADEIERMTEADLSLIVATSKQVNPRFFNQILGTLRRFAQAKLAEGGNSSSAAS